MVICACRLVMLKRVTSTPGTISPPASVTVPRKPPVVEDCAHKQEEASTKAAIRRIPTLSRLRRSLAITAIHRQVNRGIKPWRLGMRLYPRTAEPYQDGRIIFHGNTAHHILTGRYVATPPP